MNITFKKQKRETGLGRVGYPHAVVDIKLDKKIIGLIDPPTWCKNGWRIRLAVQRENGWQWITVDKICQSEEEARELAKKAIVKFASIYTFHTMGG